LTTVRPVTVKPKSQLVTLTLTIEVVKVATLERGVPDTFAKRHIRSTLWKRDKGLAAFGSIPVVV